MEEYAVAVIGDGSWATILAQMLTHTHDKVRLWVEHEAVCQAIRTHHRHEAVLPDVRLSGRIVPTTELAEAAESQLIFVALPSSSFRSIVSRLGAHLGADQVLVSCTKGLEEAAGARLSQILMQETCVLQVGVLGGPAYAAELGSGQPSAVVIGSRFNRVVVQVQAALASEQLRVYGSPDLDGVEAAGAFSTLIILAIGMAHGLRLGAGVKAVVLARGLAEITRLGAPFGIEASTFYGLAGLGDLVGAALSTTRPEHRLGEALACGSTVEAATQEVGHTECIPMARVVLDTARHHNIDLPLMGAIGDVLLKGVSPQDIIQGLMTRRSVYEERWV